MCLARSHAVTSELLRQFSACTPLNCENLNMVTSQQSHSHVENVSYIISCVCAFCVPPAHLTVMSMCSLVGLSFRERNAARKCVLARLQTVSSGLLPQFSACRPLKRDLNIVTPQYSHSNVENVLYIFRVCAFCIPRAHLTVTWIRSFVGWERIAARKCVWHACKLSAQRFCVSLVHIGH